MGERIKLGFELFSHLNEMHEDALAIRVALQSIKNTVLKNKKLCNIFTGTSIIITGVGVILGITGIALAPLTLGFSLLPITISSIVTSAVGATGGIATKVAKKKLMDSSSYDLSLLYKNWEDSNLKLLEIKEKLLKLLNEPTANSSFANKEEELEDFLNQMRKHLAANGEYIKEDFENFSNLFRSLNSNNDHIGFAALNFSVTSLGAISKFIANEAGIIGARAVLQIGKVAEVAVKGAAVGLGAIFLVVDIVLLVKDCKTQENVCINIDQFIEHMDDSIEKLKAFVSF